MLQMLHKKTFDDTYVDIKDIAYHASRKHIYNLIETVLGIIVQCPSKEEYIKPILQLDENIQSILMPLIDAALIKFDESSPELNVSNTSNEAMKLNLSVQSGSVAIKAANHEKLVLQKLEEVENENLKLYDEINSLKAERESLHDQIKELITDVSKKEQEINELVSQKSHNESSLLETETSYKKELEFKNYEINRIKDLLAEKEKKYEHEFELLKDDIKQYKIKVKSMETMESSLETYKQKYQELLKLSDKFNEREVEVKKLQAENRELLKSKETLTTKVETLQKDLDKFRYENIDVGVALDQKNNEIESLKKKLQEYKLKEELQESPMKEPANDPILATDRSQKNTLDFVAMEELKTANTEIELLKEKIKELKKENYDLTDAKADLEEKYKRLQLEKKNLEKEKKDFEERSKEYAELSFELSRLKTDLGIKQQQIDKAATTLAIRENEIEVRTVTINELEKKIDKLNEEKDKLRVISKKKYLKKEEHFQKDEKIKRLEEERTAKNLTTIVQQDWSREVEVLSRTLHELSRRNMALTKANVQLQAAAEKVKKQL